MAQFSSIMDGVSAKKDSTLSIRLGTQELSSEDKANIFEFANKQIWVALSELPIQKQDIDIPDVVYETDRKSPSQKLRAVIHILWEQNKDKTKKGSDEFYRDYMEKLIENIKDKLT